MIEKQQSLVLENRSNLKIIGVEGVINLSETDAQVLVCGEVLEIKGNSLKAEKLSVETGEMIISGNIYGLKFNDKKEKKGFIKRIFK